MDILVCLCVGNLILLSPDLPIRSTHSTIRDVGLGGGGRRHSCGSPMIP